MSSFHQDFQTNFSFQAMTLCCWWHRPIWVRVCACAYRYVSVCPAHSCALLLRTELVSLCLSSQMSFGFQLPHLNQHLSKEIQRTQSASLALTFRSAYTITIYHLKWHITSSLRSNWEILNLICEVRFILTRKGQILSLASDHGQQDKHPICIRFCYS